mgnify:CR=1 FL=1
MVSFMKLIAALGVLLIAVPVVQAQLDTKSISAAITADSGNPAEDYEAYATILAATLRLLSPQQLARVFGEGTRVAVPETLNQSLEMGDVNFAGGSPRLSSEARVELDKVAEFLALNPNTRILIEGHTQFDGDRSQSLSEERASSAANYLGSLRISLDRMETAGFGGTRPLVDNPDRGRSAANRRIEIRVIEEEEEG